MRIRVSIVPHFFEEIQLYIAAWVLGLAVGLESCKRLNRTKLLQLGLGALGFGLGSGSGLEEVFVFDSKSENRDRAIEAVESVPEARAV